MIEKYKIPVSIILGAVIIGFSLYFALGAKKSGQTTSTPSSSPIATTVVVNQSEESPISSPSPSPKFTGDDQEKIKAALAKKLGQDQDDLLVEISQNTASLAKGTIREKSSEVGGGYFLAAKAGNDWLIVYDGQSTPTCSQIAPYDFPKEWVPECLGPSGNLVKR